MIPKTIHQTWRDRSIPAYLRPFQASWRIHHADWEYRLWTDLDNRALIAEHYPWFLACYDAYECEIQRVDAARYFILHRYGGLYVDLDFECLQPLTEVLNTQTCIFGSEPEAHAAHHHRETVVANALMASSPNHPLWTVVHEQLLVKRHARNKRGEVDVLNSTGPLMLTDAIARYDGSDVTITDPGVFYPMLDATNSNLFTATSMPPKLQQLLAAKQVITRDYPSSALAVHHWAGTWYDSGSAKTELIKAMHQFQQDQANE